MKRIPRDRVVPLGERYTVTDPVETIDSGETIVVETMNHMTPVVRGESDLHEHGTPGYRERQQTGPIAVRGAKIGDALAIHIEEIELEGIPHAKGWGPFPRKYPQKPFLMPVSGDRITMPGGITLPLAPMIGDIYTMPLSPDGNFFDHGGNMDFQEIKPGSTLYLPVFKEGGLLVLGDIHAAMGAGEIYGEGAECAANVRLTIEIDRKYHYPRPLVETTTELIGLAGRGKQSAGLALAMADMTALISRLHGISMADAYVTCSLIGSQRIAACVNYGGNPIEEWALVGLALPKDIRKP